MNHFNDIFSKVGDFQKVLLGFEVVFGEVHEGSTTFNKDNAVEWCNQAIAEGCDFIYFNLSAINPALENKSADEVIEFVNSIRDILSVPAFFVGCGNVEKDNQVFEKIAPLIKGSLIGNATEDNYKTLASLALAYDLGVVSFSNIDFNIQKQVNTLLIDSGIGKERIVMDPLTGALGYGLEYTYSVTERVKLSRATDEVFRMPVLGVASKAWNSREAIDSRWETITASALVIAGADLIVVRHIDSFKKVKELLTKLGKM